MASLIPDTNYSPNTTAASNAYVAAMSNLSDALMRPISLLDKMNSDALAKRDREEEKAIRAEDRAWKLEDRDRVAKERQAEDAYYGELAKGVQTKGGIYGDALATEANKYALTPDEILKATLYKNDANAARTAGDSTLADKLAWQARVSEDVAPFMQSGLGEESRVEMYDRINSMVGSQGLPIPKEAILSADQARLAEKTAEEAASKALKESKADILKNDQANAWKYISALGNTSTVTDENGNEVQVKGPSASVQNRNNTSFNNDVDKGITDILKTIEDKAKGTESTSKAVVSDQAINLYTTLIRDQGISPEVASKLVSSGVGSEEAGWKSLWLGDPKAKLTKDQLSTILPSAMAAMELKKDAVGSTTSTVKGNDKQEAATNLIAALNTQNKTQLGSILDEQANLARGAEGRRADSVNAWLQDRGLIDVPKAVVESAVPIKTNGGETRADRNNNPGNLTGDDKWQGMVGKDGRFVQFQSYELGSRALAKNLINGAVGKTVEDYMNKYAPKSENDTNSYIKNVSKALGKEPGSVITDKDILPLMKVIARQEGGKVDEKGLEAGYKMATVFSGKEFDATNSESTIIKDLFGKVVDKKTPDLKTSNVLISTDDGLQKLREDASKVLEGTPEYNDITNEYNERVAELKDKAIGADLAAYMTRQKSGPLATKINDEIYSLIDNGLEVPAKVADFVKKGKGSVVDFNRILMEDATKGKTYIKALLKSLEKPKLQGKEVIIPDRPN